MLQISSVKVKWKVPQSKDMHDSSYRLGWRYGVGRLVVWLVVWRWSLVVLQYPVSFLSDLTFKVMSEILRHSDM